MLMSKLKVLGVLVGVLAVVVLGVALSQHGPAAAQPKNAQSELPPLSLTVGRRYEVYLPNSNAATPYGRVLVQKVFSDGWVEVKTQEGQTSFINLNHAYQIYPLEK